VSENDRPAETITGYGASPPAYAASPMSRPDTGGLQRSPSRDSLVDVLERVLDKGVVIAGDIKINLLDIELLTIKIRLLIASADKAREMGIDWWAHDPELSSKAGKQQQKLDGDQEKKQMRERIDELESKLDRLLEQQGNGRHRGELPAGERKTKAR